MFQIKLLTLFYSVMKNLLFFFIFFVVSCGGVDFVYKDNINLNNPIYNKTLVSFSGKTFPEFYRYASLYFGSNEEHIYSLKINIEEKKIKRSVQTNQAISKMDYELGFGYELFSKTKGCIIYKKNILSRFSFEPKSSGYNFGSDQSLEKLYELATKESFKQFVDFYANDRNVSCSHEG